jgi:hypothetical protein
MPLMIHPRLWLVTLGLLIPLGLAQADEPSKTDGSKESTKPDPKQSAPPALGLLDAMRSGAISVDAQGQGDGNMNLIVTNQTKRKLRVVLPPGLVASGATGQFGGMAWAAAWEAWAAAWVAWAARAAAWAAWAV